MLIGLRDMLARTLGGIPEVEFVELPPKSMAGDAEQLRRAHDPTLGQLERVYPYSETREDGIQMAYRLIEPGIKLLADVAKGRAQAA